MEWERGGFSRPWIPVRVHPTWHLGEGKIPEMRDAKLSVTVPRLFGAV